MPPMGALTVTVRIFLWDVILLTKLLTVFAKVYPCREILDFAGWVVHKMVGWKWRYRVGQ